MPCRPLSEHELKRLLGKMVGKYAARNRLLMVLLTATGFRISEALSLKIQDVWQFGQIPTDVTVGKQRMKGKRQARTVPLNNKVKPFIRDWVSQSLNAGRKPTDALFWGQKNPQQSITRQNFDMILDKAIQKAYLTGNIASHSGRKTFANDMLVRLDGSLLDVQEALGHADPKSTLSYIKANNTRIRAAILADD